MFSPTRRDIIPNSEDVLLRAAVGVGFEGLEGQELPPESEDNFTIFFEKSFLKSRRTGGKGAKENIRSLISLPPSFCLLILFSTSCLDPPPPIVTNKKGQTVNKIFLYN